MAATGIRLSKLIYGVSRGSLRSMVLGLAMVSLTSNLSTGGVLNDSDLRKVSDIKPLFTSLMGDLVQSSKRTDLSSGDADCVKSTIKELMQISDELSSYEYLITIENQLNDSADSKTMRGIVKFAIDQSNTILAGERKRLAALSDQCSRYPFSFGKTQQALQFIDTTTDLLNAIGLRL
jgi:hypothetical protein